MSDIPLGGGFAPDLFERRTLDETMANRLAGRAVAEWMRWAGQWVTGRAYQRHDVVRDGQWTMVCTTTNPLGTFERAGIIPLGEPAEVYDGLSPTDSVSAAQLIVGQRYTIEENGFMQAARFYSVAGNLYRVVVVADPEGAADVQEILAVDAQTTGWVEIPLGVTVLPVGAVFDVYVSITEPPAVPVEWTGDWFYDTPNNPGAVLAGVCQHANSTQSELRFSTTDNDSGDREAELLAMVIGDVISTPQGNWWIQSPPVAGAGFVSFAVAPGQQQGADGVRTFTFQTSTVTPITTVVDVGYWSGSTAVQGLIAVDEPASDATLNDNQYGVDIFVTRAQVPTEWELMAWGNA